MLPQAWNPDLIYLSAFGFGADGPKSGQRIYDPIIQAGRASACLLRSKLSFDAALLSDTFSIPSDIRSDTLSDTRSDRGGLRVLQVNTGFPAIQDAAMPKLAANCLADKTSALTGAQARLLACCSIIQTGWEC